MTTMVGVSLAGRQVVMVGGGDVAARRIRRFLLDGARDPRGRPRAVRGHRAPGRRRRARVARRAGWSATTSTMPGSCTPRPAMRGWTPRSPPSARIAGSSASTPATAVTARPGSPPRHGRATASSASSRMPAWIPAARSCCATPSPSRLREGSLPLRRRRPTTVGQVHLVGGGPGPVDLITVRGRRAARRGGRRRRRSARTDRRDQRTRPRGRDHRRRQEPRNHPVPQA